MTSSISPDWTAPENVRALVTTRMLGDMSLHGEGRRVLGGVVPSEPVWLRQVHGTTVLDLDSREKFSSREPREADAAVTRTAGKVCVVGAADCMPVLLCDEAGTTVGAAHAGWRGLSGGVIEATLEAMRLAPERTLAWLGPAIGPRVYEVGDEVRAAFVDRDAAAAAAFAPTRPGHWLLDLYMVARQRLAARGIRKIFGGGFCTYGDSARFFSYRRDKSAQRMAALIWLT